ncbi:adenylate kinase 8 [Gouania willdenowi]|uniref:Nucleoside-diphosphate kinase n=1 Tax=Gouania willdenowi TaxID=441366 RepID=A0A8C5G8K2_GOUWI|nr:adenylate kinase 8 [Gouania willdenowi]
MDETVKPLRIPPQVSLYNDTHHVIDLVQSLLCSLVLEQPDDPISFLMKVLKKSSENTPSVIILGPPSVGKHTVAKRLSSELKAVHVTTDSLLDQLDGDQGDNDFLLQLLQKRLKEPDCFNTGWVLEGFPQTRLQALTLQQAGVIPAHVVFLQAPEDVLFQRGHGRLVDPVTGDIYHQTFIQPANDVIAGRLQEGRSLSEEEHQLALQRYHTEVTGLMSAYQHSLKVINADQPQEDVYQQVLSFVQTRQSSRIPRILLLGPPGSGKSLQARLLSEKYRLVDVGCSELLRASAADGSSLGQKIIPYLDEGRGVSDSLVLQTLEERLSRLDCSSRGWILHGFPENLQQARSLQDGLYRPNRVFLLELTDEVCLERLTLRAVDPVSGQSFHAVTQPPPTFEVQNRLRTRTQDSRECVSERVREFRLCMDELQCVFPDVVHVDADQDPHAVFEALESRLTEA